MLCLPGAVLLMPFGENMNRYQNPFRRPPMISIFVTLSTIAIWLGVGGLGSIFNAIPLLEIDLPLGICINSQKVSVTTYGVNQHGLR